MTVSIDKSEWMIFGPLPPTHQLPKMLVGGNPIKLVHKFKYVGMWFTSTHRYIFAVHYSEKAAKARTTTNGSFVAQQYIGSLPPIDGITLYNARVDPHLTFGCEVSLDVDPSLLASLEDVQLAFLRRLLHVNSCSEKLFLFTETGMIPLRFRRIILALGYLPGISLLQRLKMPCSYRIHPSPTGHLISPGYYETCSQPAPLSQRT
ncbi:hypothetical protein V5O48_019287, partial [Marasmius crinis-equi]